MTWVCYLKDMRQGEKPKRKAAMNLVDRPYRPGAARVVNGHTGEVWHRRSGSWYRDG